MERHREARRDNEQTEKHAQAASELARRRVTARLSSLGLPLRQRGRRRPAQPPLQL